MTHDNDKPVDRSVEGFIRRLLAAAPDLSEEQVENIRRLAAGEMPTDRRQA